MVRFLNSNRSNTTIAGPLVRLHGYILVVFLLVSDGYVSNGRSNKSSNSIQNFVRRKEGMPKISTNKDAKMPERHTT